MRARNEIKKRRTSSAQAALTATHCSTAGPLASGRFDGMFGGTLDDAVHGMFGGRSLRVRVLAFACDGTFLGGDRSIRRALCGMPPSVRSKTPRATPSATPRANASVNEVNMSALTTDGCCRTSMLGSTLAKSLQCGLVTWGDKPPRPQLRETSCCDLSAGVPLPYRPMPSRVTAACGHTISHSLV